MRLLATTMVLGAALLVPVYSQTQQDDDGPGRGVARLSLLNGDVSIRRGDSGDVVAAAPNAPLVVQDRVLTGPTSRAEIQFDYSNMIRVGANAEVRLSELEFHRYQIQIALGTTTFRVLRDQVAQVEISTPSVAVRPLRQGVYRVTVHQDGTSEISIRSGEAEIFSPRGTERLGSGRTMIARGSASDPEFQMTGGLPYDEWDRWNESRDGQLKRTQSYNYVPQDVYGAEDLDGYGSWVDVPSYGRVWRPVVVSDWAPYRYGRWSWVDYYGWTWVSYDPWGWAPYHYGRWFYDGGMGWCWWPGGPGRHYWRPALVGFFGWGGGGVGFGFGHVGWVPLAPHEPYHPWYGRGYYGAYRGGFGHNTTIVNNINITNVYRNARVNNGITGMNADHFGRGGITPGGYTRVSSSDVQRAGLMRGQLPMAPGRESLRMSDRQAPASAPMRTASDSRQFYSTRTPSHVDRVPFEQQRQSMEQSTRRGFVGGSTSPNAGGGWRRMGDTGGTSPSPRAESPAMGTPNQGSGWRRMGDNGGTSTPSPSAPSRGGSFGNEGGNSWHRFGEPTQHPATGGSVGRTAPSPRSEPSYDSRPSVENRSSAPRGGDFGSSSRESAPLRINPPIVRERSSSPSYSSPQPRSEGRGGGGGGYWSPRSSGGDSGRGYSPAPRSDGGNRGGGFGGGSAPRSSGGGGGGGGSVSRGGGNSGGGGGGGPHRR